MKKLIAIFLTIASIFSFFILFNNKQSQQQNEMESAEQQLNYSYQIILPSEISNMPQDEAYLKIRDALDKYNGNIYYSRLKGNKQIKFVYTTNFDYFSKFILQNGQKFTKEDIETNKFLSTVKTNDTNQVGTIASFAGTYFEIRTLKDMVQSGYLLDGYCIVSFNNENNVKLFINDIERSFNINNGIQFIPIQHYNYQLPIESKDIWIVLGIYFIVMLLILYNILKSYKAIGIEKLMGFSILTIYFKRIFSLIKIQLIIMVLSTCFMLSLLFKTYNQYFWLFLYKLINIYMIEIVLFIVICSIPFLYIHKIKIVYMLKNKKPTSEIILFNFFVKTIMLIILLLALNQGLTNFNMIKNVFTNSFKQWDQIKNYAVIPNLSNISPDKLETSKYYEDQKKIYTIFSNEGSILANFSEYEPGTRKIRFSETKFDYQRDNITVNPNYLKKYPIYDINNKIVYISEKESNYIVLIPEKYKPEEKEIRKLFELWKDARKDKIEQPIKIIWIKSNQKLFSMLVDVNPNEGNYVTDPIIHVLTESNGALQDYDTVLGISSNPFKIKVNDYLNPSNTIRPVLKQFGYNEYVKDISLVNEQIASQSKDVKDMITYLLVTISLVGGCILLLILQNIYNYFEKYKQYIAIKQLHGYGVVAKYKSYILMFILNWFIIIAVTITTKLINLSNLLKISIFCAIIELIITLFIILFLIDKTKVIKAIKGED